VVQTPVEARFFGLIKSAHENHSAHCPVATKVFRGGQGDPGMAPGSKNICGKLNLYLPSNLHGMKRDNITFLYLFEEFHILSVIVHVILNLSSIHNFRFHRSKFLVISDLKPIFPKQFRGILKTGIVTKFNIPRHKQ